MLTMKNSLYNPDGTLSSEAHYFAATRPSNLTTAEWSKIRNEFKFKLSTEEAQEFQRLIRKKIRERHYSCPENKEKKKVQDAEWNKNNLEKGRMRTAKYYLKNRTKIYNKQSECSKNNPTLRFFNRLRDNCYRVIKYLSLGKTHIKTFEWIGCSPEELRVHFESLFQEGMSWENYGTWHIDHIRPVSSFSVVEWKQVNHYTNLQPLWAADNLSKSDKWN